MISGVGDHATPSLAASWMAATADSWRPLLRMSRGSALRALSVFHVAVFTFNAVSSVVALIEEFLLLRERA